MSDKGWIATLFDLSFSSFLTIKIIRVLYILAIVGVALGALSVLLSSALQNGAIGVVIGLVGAVVVFFVGVLLARVYMEIIMVMFRIAENTTVMAAAMTAKDSSEPASAAPSVERGPGY